MSGALESALVVPLIAVGVAVLLAIPILKGINSNNQIGPYERRLLAGFTSFFLAFGYSVVFIWNASQFGWLLTALVVSCSTNMFLLVLRWCRESARREASQLACLQGLGELVDRPQMGRGKRLFRALVMIWAAVNILGTLIAIILRARRYS